MSEAIATPPPQLRVDYLRVDGIRPDPQNPRKTFRDIDQLAESIRTRGLQIPLTVRPCADEPEAPFVLVFGERRWRAAKKAGLVEVPCLVREMSDAEALELMLVELAQTSDVHPVEEADAYLRLHAMRRGQTAEDPGEEPLSVEEIAAKVGKSVSHVYGRMKLASLDEAVRKETLEGDLPATLALAIARVSPSLQAEAMAAVRPTFSDHGWRPYREAVGILRQKFMLSLAEVPWDLKDEHLIEAAGSCAKCPERSGNQPELFGGEKVAKDICLKPKCFGDKKSAFVALRIKTAQDEGKPVLSTTEAKKVIGQHGEIKDSSFVDLDKKDWFNDKLMTLREKLGKKVPETTLAPTADGLVELASREEVDKLLGRDKEKQRQAAENEKHRQENAKAAAANVQHLKVRALVFSEIINKAEKGEFSKGVWFEIAAHLLEKSFEYDPLPDETMIRRLGRASPEDADFDKEMEQVKTAMAKMSLEQLRGFVVELILAVGYDYNAGQEGLFKELQRMYGVDEKKIAEKLKAKEKKGMCDCGKFELLDPKKGFVLGPDKIKHTLKGCDPMAPAKKPKVVKKATAKKKAKKK